MTTKLTGCGLAISLTVFLWTQNSMATITYGEWQTWQGMEVGEIVKTSPRDYNNLHYRGTKTPETAGFSISGKDLDRRCVMEDGKHLDWEIKDAGLDPRRTIWTCTGEGRIDRGKLTTTYIPAKVPETPVKIRCKVFNGPKYNPNDPPVEKEWYSWLNTFKVGILLSGLDKDVEIWEDDPRENIEFTDDTFDKATTQRVNTYKTQDTQGRIVSERSSRKDLVWKTVARSGDRNIEAIQKNIAFAPSIVCSGTYWITMRSNTLHTPGTGSSIVLDLLGDYSPYLKATITASLVTLSKNCSACDAYIAGVSIIENNNPTRKISQVWQHVHSGDAKVNMSDLSIKGTRVALVPNNQRQGSIEIKTMVGGTDYSRDDKIYTSIDTFGPPRELTPIIVTTATTRPVYFSSRR